MGLVWICRHKGGRGKPNELDGTGDIHAPRDAKHDTLLKDWQSTDGMVKESRPLINYLLINLLSSLVSNPFIIILSHL